MPQCYQLSRKTSKDFEAVALNTIDEEICAKFNEPVHPTQWCHGWHNYIGFELATDHTFEQVIAGCDTVIAENAGHAASVAYWQRMKEIAEFLNANFVSNAFYEVSRPRT